MCESLLRTFPDVGIDDVHGEAVVQSAAPTRRSELLRMNITVTTVNRIY
jgi:hypothetical protein